MRKNYLNAQQSLSITKILEGDASDPVELVKQAKLDHRRFFEGYNWSGVDFRKSDLTDVSFLGSDLTQAIFSDDQMRFLYRNGYIDSNAVFSNQNNIETKRIHISLIGPFRIVDESDSEITPRSPKQCALMALLATGKDYTRSRGFLQNCLWEDSTQQKAAASLRTALHSLRNSFRSYPSLFHTTPYLVRLDSSLVAVDIENPDPSRIASSVERFQILEGIDIGTDSFEDWLRSQRSVLEELKTGKERSKQ